MDKVLQPSTSWRKQGKKYLASTDSEGENREGSDPTNDGSHPTKISNPKSEESIDQVPPKVLKRTVRFLLTDKIFKITMTVWSKLHLLFSMCCIYHYIAHEIRWNSIAIFVTLLPHSVDKSRLMTIIKPGNYSCNLFF